MDEERRPARVIGKVIKGDSLPAPEPSPAPEAKAQQPTADKQPARPRVVNAEEYDARTRAQEIVDKAQAEAQRIVAEAEARRDEIFAKARDEARAEVHAKAAEEIAKAKIQAGDIMDRSEPEIVDLSLRIAAKIVGRDLERDPDVVVDIVATAMESARAAKAMTIRVNPEDGKLLRDRRPRLMELIGRAIDIAVRDDPEVERGGCIIQTDYGVIDGQLKTQFEMLAQLLKPENSKREVK